MAAFYKHIKIAHVEAGLRTNNLQSPWPEEMNRQVTDRICDYYFAPTDLSRRKLLSEGIKDEKILVTGNTVIDALLGVTKKINNDPSLQQQLQHQITIAGYSKIFNYILVTGHRR